jgi:hypothetical protein
MTFTKDQYAILQAQLDRIINAEGNECGFAVNDDGIDCLADSQGYYPLKSSTTFEEILTFLSALDENEIEDLDYDGSERGFWLNLWSFVEPII